MFRLFAHCRTLPRSAINVQGRGSATLSSLWQHLKQAAEPSSATVLAALLSYPDRFTGLCIVVVLTGGNVDLDALPWFASLSAVASSLAR